MNYKEEYTNRLFNLILKAITLICLILGLFLFTNCSKEEPKEYYCNNARYKAFGERYFRKLFL